ncbi:MAG: LytTR family DNA-binding domain-containing protein [Lachnospiraceae bacterium]|nr:LytTR family DNA-binding domain-containing protein [Lachnospiraceae bacterium]
MIIEIGILEDNLMITEQITKALNDWSAEHKHTFHIQTFQNGTAILDSLSKINFDVCFLDIQLDMKNPNAETGMDIARQMRQLNYSGELIFLTSYREYVFDGYDVNAFHYLLKPVEPETLFPVLSAFINHYTHQNFILKNGQQIERIPYQQIITINSNLHSITIITTDKNYTTHSSIGEVEGDLPPAFVRCHRSCIVNLYHIIKIDGSILYLTNDLTQTISRNYLADIKNAYIHYAVGTA